MNQNVLVGSQSKALAARPSDRSIDTDIARSGAARLQDYIRKFQLRTKLCIIYYIAARCSSADCVFTGIKQQAPAFAIWRSQIRQALIEKLTFSRDFNLPAVATLGPAAG